MGCCLSRCSLTKDVEPEKEERGVKHWCPVPGYPSISSDPSSEETQEPSAEDRPADVRRTKIYADVFSTTTDTNPGPTFTGTIEYLSFIPDANCAPLDASTLEIVLLYPSLSIRHVCTSILESIFAIKNFPPMFTKTTVYGYLWVFTETGGAAEDARPEKGKGGDPSDPEPGDFLVEPKKQGGKRWGADPDATVAYMTLRPRHVRHMKASDEKFIDRHLFETNTTDPKQYDKVIYNRKNSDITEFRKESGGRQRRQDRKEQRRRKAVRGLDWLYEDEPLWEESV